MIRKKGKIVQWDDTKGFGFILSEDSSKHIFVHIKSFIDRRMRPSLNENVTYTVYMDKNDKTSAINVTRETDKPKVFQQKNKKNVTLKSIAHINKNKNNNYKIDYKSTHKISIFPILFIIGFSTFLIYSSIYEQIPFFIIILYLFMSIITYVAYSSDKSYAITQKYRVPENTLHILSLLGGWIGALIAQQRFRHKTKKISFKIVFWITVLLNISILVHQFGLLYTKS
mgnify:CR=1 FL=1